MAEKKLPEINIGEGKIVTDTASLVTIRAEKAQLETREKELIATVATAAVVIRDEKLEAGQVLGLIRVTNDHMPVQVQFKIDDKKAALDINEGDNLDELFGGARPLLFGMDQFVTEITDPEAIITAMKASGRNPWDFLSLTVKAGQDAIIAQYPQAISSEAFMPRKGFLSTLHDVWHTLSVEAIGYLKTYIKTATKPCVVVGSQGKAK